MHRCIQLALLGAGSVAPNPMVGAVLVYRDRIIAEGYHQIYGQAHAEVNCINNVSEQDRKLISQSILYVSLEPCSHYGKTPPCADLIIREKIADVRIGCIDTTPKVNGQGIRKLRDAGIKVQTGICETECIRLNKRFFTYNLLQRPFIILKWAQSANGITGKSGNRVSISNQYTNRLVHRWRSEESAILVGSKTAVNDDPALDNRLWAGKSPLRIILAGEVVPAGLKMFSQNGKTVIFNTRLNGDNEKVSLVKIGKENYLNQVMAWLYNARVQSILTEGGAFTHQKFFEAGLWDECRVITNRNRTIANGLSAPELPEMKSDGQEEIMDDLIQYYHNPHNQLLQ